jgi:hypothetical protein
MVFMLAADDRLIFMIVLQSAVRQISYFETMHWKSKAVYLSLHLFYKGGSKRGIKYCPVWAFGL